jgi:hypothetical protein
MLSKMAPFEFSTIELVLVIKHIAKAGHGEILRNATSSANTRQENEDKLKTIYYAVKKSLKYRGGASARNNPLRALFPLANQ